MLLLLLLLLRGVENRRWAPVFISVRQHSSYTKRDTNIERYRFDDLEWPVAFCIVYKYSYSLTYLLQTTPICQFAPPFQSAERVKLEASILVHLHVDKFSLRVANHHQVTWWGLRDHCSCSWIRDTILETIRDRQLQWNTHRRRSHWGTEARASPNLACHIKIFP